MQHFTCAYPAAAVSFGLCLRELSPKSLFQKLMEAFQQKRLVEKIIQEN
jgi:hypothetical protein